MSAMGILLVCLIQMDSAHSFVLPKPSSASSHQHSNLPSSPPITKKISQQNKNLILSAKNDNDDKNNSDDKFSFPQKIESIKTAALGAIAGGIVATPFIALHDIPAYGAAAWEFDTDMGSLQSALFAIVYRYCVREEDDNEMLNMGVVGAFVVVRTLSRIRVPSYCTAVPLDCGAPLGYFDYNMLQQLALNGLESAALFGGAAAAMEYAYSKKWISKFPN
eukprot:CAMPEP_0201873976 /NCGR_PEP_ID=MMETSP0902-20130614/6356_1 /ASSEMBLY_ACC=CAM_ASM_000551 /TAXON_ID=420261 /ORGANISM="Thalassiosira antarctica, Strain CCMP982" /LENGTH=219 /DNA_ID=CAMNT_0048400729 /DNA_START=57 /DNA_END=716 /DNA_ORIENTATION=+